jgi:hypothetical protein
MKSLIVAALAVVALGGCVAVPGPYYPADAYYYSGPAVGVGIYSSPGFHHHRHRHQRHRHHHRR